MPLIDASLDTSFWNIAAQIGVAPYLFSFFRVHYCTAVEREIVSTDPGKTPLIYPQAMLFRLLQEDGRFHLVEPEKIREANQNEHCYCGKDHSNVARRMGRINSSEYRDGCI
jgi:hypothetical protein